MYSVMVRKRNTPSPPIETLRATARERLAEMMLLVFPGWPNELEEIIYLSEDNADISVLLKTFIDELPGGLSHPLADTVISVIQDSWNYLPHKRFGDRSPAEIFHALRDDTDQHSAR